MTWPASSRCRRARRAAASAVKVNGAQWRRRLLNRRRPPPSCRRPRAGGVRTLKTAAASRDRGDGDSAPPVRDCVEAPRRGALIQSAASPGAADDELRAGSKRRVAPARPAVDVHGGAAREPGQSASISSPSHRRQAAAPAMRRGSGAHSRRRRPPASPPAADAAPPPTPTPTPQPAASAPVADDPVPAHRERRSRTRHRQRWRRRSRRTRRRRRRRAGGGTCRAIRLKEELRAARETARDLSAVVGVLRDELGLELAEERRSRGVGWQEGAVARSVPAEVTDASSSGAERGAAVGHRRRRRFATALLTTAAREAARRRRASVAASSDGDGPSSSSTRGAHTGSAAATSAEIYAAAVRTGMSFEGSVRPPKPALEMDDELPRERSAGPTVRPGRAWD